jgi:hypothetical protein
LNNTSHPGRPASVGGEWNARNCAPLPATSCDEASTSASRLSSAPLVIQYPGAAPVVICLYGRDLVAHRLIMRDGDLKARQLSFDEISRIFERIKKGPRARTVMPSDREKWLRRRRIHLGQEEEFSKVGRFPPDPSELARGANELGKQLGLSGRRLTLFKRCVVEHRNYPTVENYMRIRRKFPELDVHVGRFGGQNAVCMMHDKLQGQGIDVSLVLDALKLDEYSIDMLSLCLLERLVARGKLPKHGPGYIEKRRTAISDITVNYLLSEILTAVDWSNANIRLPASFIVLVRQQLCGEIPDLLAEYLLLAKRHQSMHAAAEYFHRTKQKISIGKLASATGVSRSTAARWLNDAKFLKSIKIRMWLLQAGLVAPS